MNAWQAFVLILQLANQLKSSFINSHFIKYAHEVNVTNLGGKG